MTDRCIESPEYGGPTGSASPKVSISLGSRFEGLIEIEVSRIIKESSYDQ
jgi:hypothetical protein